MSISSESDDILDPILRAFEAKLKQQINGHLVTTYLQGSAQMIAWGKTAGGIPITFEGPPTEEAIRWAERHGARLVTQMAEETKTQLAKIISEGIKSKRGISGLARDIRKQFGNMSRYRSRMIARTETASALGESFIARGKDMGIDGKEWVTVGDAHVSDICHGNEAMGIIPLSQPFPSGDMAPPAHPNCRCALAPAMVAS